jgi:hypothetical protein
MGMKGTTLGTVDVYIDDVLKATVNCYASTASYQQIIYLSDPLPHGAHTMRLVRNSVSPTGSYIVLDRVDTLGTIR